MEGGLGGPHGQPPVGPTKAREEAGGGRRFREAFADLEGQGVGSRIDLHDAPVRWLWRRKLGDRVARPGVPRKTVSGRLMLSPGTLHYGRQSRGVDFFPSDTSILGSSVSRQL